MFAPIIASAVVVLAPYDDEIGIPEYARVPVVAVVPEDVEPAEDVKRAIEESDAIAAILAAAGLREMPRQIRRRDGETDDEHFRRRIWIETRMRAYRHSP